MIYVFLVGKQNILDNSAEALACECSASFKLLGTLYDYGHYCALYSCEDQALEALRIVNLEEKYDFDILALKSIPNLNKPGIAVLDMDMTSVQIEGIDEIARALKVFDKVAAITSKAMHGGLDFASSLRERVSMLKDGNADVICKVKEIMTETAGLDNLMAVTAENKWARGICSGGFVQLIEVLERKYNLEMVCANSLEIAAGKFTGKVVGDIVDAEAKRKGVLSLMSEYHVDKSQVIVLGDGANDLQMLSEAGVGIAYHAKPKVKAQAQCALNKSDLNAVVLLLKLAAKTIYA